jgi:hypothetical protein
MTDAPMQARPTGAELRVGHVLSRSWEIFSANFLAFFIIAAAVALPNALFFTADPTATPSFDVWRVLASVLLGIVLNMIAQAMILYIAFQYLRGQPAGMADAVRKGLNRFMPIIAVSILAALGTGLGAMLLLVPGVILAIMWSVALPACVVEGLGPIASLRRSANLTKGYRWKIFGIFLLLMVVSLVGAGLIGLLSFQLGPVVTAIVHFVLNAVWAAYFNSLLVMIYHDLRVAKEGVDIEQIAAVFD